MKRCRQNIAGTDKREKYMKNVHIMDHPLIQHKISRLRDKNTGTNVNGRYLVPVQIWSKPV